MKKTLLIAAFAALLAMTVVAIGGGTVITQPSGSHLSGGTTDTLTKWTSSTTLGNSAITDFRASGVSVSIASTGKVSTGDTASTSVDNNVDVLTVANSGQANTTDGLKLLKLDGSTMTFDLASSKTNYGAYVDVRAPDVAGCGAPCTSQSGIMKNVGVFSNAQGGDVSHSFVAANGDAVFTDPVRIGGTVAGAYAADDGDEALILQPNATGLTFDYQAIYSAPVVTLNATAATRKSYGVYADNQSTKSAGGNQLWNTGVYGTASGGDIDIGVWGFAGAGDIAGYFSGAGEFTVETDNTNISSTSLRLNGTVTVNDGADQPNATLTATNTDIDAASNSGTLKLGTLMDSGGTITVGNAAVPTTVSGPITVGDFRGSPISISSVTGTLNDWAPTGLSGAKKIRVTLSGNATINGITGGVAGRELEICSVSGTFTLAFAHQTGGTAANRLILPNNETWTMPTTNTTCAGFTYDGTDSRWRMSYWGASSYPTLTTSNNTQLGDQSTDLVGIGTAPEANGPLGFAAAVGNKIQLYPIGATTQYGLGIQSNVLQLYAPSTTDRVALGYGDSDAFNERFSVGGTSIVSGSGNNTRTRVHGHLTSKMSGLPNPTSCGSSPSVNTNSTDNAGTFTTGSGATACTITFASSYSGGTVHCVVTAQSGSVPSYSTSVTALTLSTAGASTTYSYICMCGDTTSGTCN